MTGWTRAAAALAATAALVAGCTDDTPAARPTPASASPTPTASTTPSPSPSATPTPSPTGFVTDAYPKQALRWRSCGGGFQCSTLRVPLDYTKPTGRAIELSVIRLRASGPARERIGSLLLNPGGPGGSGVQFARQARGLLPAEVRRRFDVVSFDPRGVGASTPVRCAANSRELDRFLAADPAPDSSAELDALVRVNNEFNRGCVRRAGWLLPHIGSVNVVRDMDVLRRALGDPKLTYLGFSYGTVLGALYAEQFPTRVRALVLDGAVDIALSARDSLIGQARGFERALDAFVRDCERRTSCPLNSFGDVERAIDTIFARVEQEPLRASGDSRRLGPGELFYGVAAGLYSPDWSWPALAAALRQAYNGDGTAMLDLFDQLVDRRDDGSYTNAVEALIAVSCTDASGESATVEQARADAQRVAREAPHFGAALAYGLIACNGWPKAAVERDGPVRARGVPPVLVVGTTGDPATPYEWAQSMARQIPGAVLLTYVGEGHTAYGFGRARCVDQHVNSYLIDRKLPPRGTRCTR